jgi:hypothetical protein
VMLGGLQTEKRIRDFTIMEETNKYIKWDVRKQRMTTDSRNKRSK